MGVYARDRGHQPAKVLIMTKGSAFDFLGLYENILLDISRYFPNDRTEWERDLVTLTRYFRTNGQALFTIDLPALGKALDRALSDGLLVKTRLALSGPRFPNTIPPRLFWGLWSRLFELDGCLKPDIDPNAVFFLRTLLYAGKNLEWECAPRYLFETTKEFFDVEAKVFPPSQIWDDGIDIACPCDLGHLRDLDGRGWQSGLFFSGQDPTSFVLESAQRVADRLVSDLSGFLPSELSFRHGPGAVSDVGRGGYKYSFPNWSPRLDRDFPFESYGSTPWGLLERLQSDGLGIGSTEPASKLIAVPKTQKGPRLIASEPDCNQWVQQGIRDFLYRRIERTIWSKALTFTSQEPSRMATLSGSINGSISTIDLKSASDRLSCHVVQRVFRRNLPLLSAMIDCRTRYMENTIDRKFPSLVKLRKFSTQGSALTFPVQSIVFLSFAIGTGMCHEPRWKFKDWTDDRYFRHLVGKVHVFGDDIIVPRTWEPLLTLSLERVGLLVNRTKTFSDGYFRESCGMDAWKGYDVTPPHITMAFQESQARTVASNVAVANNFFLKGLWNAADWLMKTVTIGLIPIVGTRSGIFGFKSFCGAPLPLITKWSTETHQDIALVRTIIARNKVVKQDTAASLLQFFTEKPSPYVLYESGVVVAGTPVMKRAWVPLELLA